MSNRILQGRLPLMIQIVLKACTKRRKPNSLQDESAVILVEWSSKSSKICSSQRGWREVRSVGRSPAHAVDPFQYQWFLRASTTRVYHAGLPPKVIDTSSSPKLQERILSQSSQRSESVLGPHSTDSADLLMWQERGIEEFPLLIWFTGRRRKRCPLKRQFLIRTGSTKPKLGIGARLWHQTASLL